jgi:hypothetical protein
VCSSRLVVKNKTLNSAIGGLGGAAWVVVFSMLILLGVTPNGVWYIGLFVPYSVFVILLVWVLADKYIKVEIEKPATK